MSAIDLHDLHKSYGVVRYAQRAFWRNRRGIFLVAFPLMFLIVFGSLNSGHIESRGNLSFIDFYVPGIVTCAIVLTCFNSTALTFAGLRANGVLKRLRTTPLPWWVFVAGSIGSTLLVVTLSIAIMLAVGILAFGAHQQTSTLPGFLITLVLGCACADMIRVLLAEDQAMVREALASLLGLEDDIEIVAQVGRGDEVAGAACATRPDVALLDIEMPGMTGLEAASALRAKLPACRIVILTTFGRVGYVRRAMAAGATGFLLKDAPAHELADAVRRVVAGERVVDAGLAAAALAEGDTPLTTREREVLARAREHGTVAELAGALHLPAGTTRNHLSAIMGKLGARSRSTRSGWRRRRAGCEAAAYAGGVFNSFSLAWRMSAVATTSPPAFSTSTT